MPKFEASGEQELMALEDAIQSAIVVIDNELKRKRAAPYHLALAAQRARYSDLLARVKAAK